MDESVLFITVRLLDGRFHGLPEWPPSPFRLYQALVAGAMLGERDGWIETVQPAFEWLERLEPPTVAVPPHGRGKRVVTYVPNNDLDTVGGDPRFISSIRGATKRIHPRLIASDAPLAYLWGFRDEHSERKQAERIAEVARRVFQFGRGVDMAYASGEILSRTVAEDKLRTFGLTPYSPSDLNNRGVKLRVPSTASLQSLLNRHRAKHDRLQDGHLTQALPPEFEVAYYGSSPTRLLFDLVRNESGESRFYRVPLRSVCPLVERVRDLLAHLLKASFGESLVERIVIGRGADDADKARRLQIIPIPSIGSAYADQAARRILFMVPPDCPIPASEIEWAAGIVHLGATEDGELVDPNQPQLVRSTDEKMLEHYGIRKGAGTVWRSVTPVVLSAGHLERRAAGNSRSRQEARVAVEIRAALRHAAVSTPVSAVRVQQQPFGSRGAMAARFDRPARFSGRGLYHAEITFTDAHRGPLIVGDGRYVGLGLFAPAKDVLHHAFVFELPRSLRLDGRQRVLLIEMARRALMSLAASSRGQVPRIFSGHEQQGGAASSGRHEHVFLAVDTGDDGRRCHRLLVVAPWLGDRRCVSRPWEREQFDKVVRSLKWLGGNGFDTVRLPAARAADRSDPIFGSAYAWETCTPYRPTIHPKSKVRETMIERDVVNECWRRGLPRPSVKVVSCEQGSRGGNVLVELQIEFRVAVDGPIMLGRDSHLGGGLFKVNGH